MHSLSRFAVEEVPGTFAPGGSAHARTSTWLDHPRRNRRWALGAASHAASRGAVSSGVPPHGGLLPSGRRRRRCGVARCLPSLGRGRATARRAPREGRTGSEGQRNRQGRQRPKEAGAGEDRTLEVVLARHSRRCRSRQTVFGAEKRTPSISPDLEAVRGRAPSTGYRVRKHAGHGRRDTGTHGQAETSRDRFQAVARPAQGAGGWRWKASRIVRRAYPSRTLIQHGLGKPGFGCPATSGVAGSGSDRGVRGSVVSGVHGRRTPRANPGPPAEADRAS